MIAAAMAARASPGTATTWNTYADDLAELVKSCSKLTMENVGARALILARSCLICCRIRSSSLSAHPVTPRWLGADRVTVRF